MSRSRLLASIPLTFVALAAAAAQPALAAATTAAEAERKALAALDVRSAADPVVVFRQPGTVPARSEIRQAGARDAHQARAARGADAALRRAGATTVRAPYVLRTGDEPSWLFYEDRAPYQAFQHAGRVVLVGTRSGRVRVSRALQWPPLIAGRLPAFLADYDAYRSDRYRVFARAWRLSDGLASSRVGALPGGTLLDRRTAAYGPGETTLAPAQRAIARAATPGASSAHQRAADRLAAERSCVIRISDTLGDFYDAGPVDRTRAEIGSAFVRLARQNDGFRTARYRYRDGRTPAAFVRRTIAREGCRDVLIYVAGGGYRHGVAAVNVGTRTRSGGRLDQQLVTATDLRSMARANRGVSFKLVIDAPYSGGFLPTLRGERNVTLLLTSSGAREGSFVDLGSVVDAAGQPVENRYNGRHYLEFSNQLLEGLQCFLSRPAEVDRAIALQDAGQVPSFLAWMVDRGFSLCAEGSLARRVVGAPRPTVFRRGPEPTPAPAPAPAPSAPLPDAVSVTPGPVVAPNAPPIALAASVTTPEDTPVALTLAGTDPDGDPLTVAIVDRPEHGTLSGSGATLAYAPDADFHGPDRLTFTVSDGQATSAPATVAIDVTSVNDAPTVGGIGSVGYVEGHAPVPVAPAATVADVDDPALVGATVRIGTGFETSEDELAFVDQAGISGSYDAATGVLTLSGTASVADYQAALRSVTYENLDGDDPSDAPRELAMTVDDGDLESDPATGAITVEPVNDAPVLGGGGNTVTFPEDDVDGVIVNPTVTVSDVDSPTVVGATVQIASGLVPSEDRLLFVDQAGISGSYDAATGTLTLTGTASLAAYQAALRSVRYGNVNAGQPSNTPRQVQFRVDDGAATSNVSVAIVSTVEIDPSDDAPVLTAGGAAATFTEGGPAVVVDPGLSVVDVDSPTITGATASISAGFVADEDELRFINTATITGSYNTATGVLTLTGNDTVASYQAAVRSITYRNVDHDDPSSTTRTISFTVANALPSNAVTTDVTVTPVNDAPTVVTSSGTAAFVEDGPPVVVDPGVTLADADDTELAGATVQLGVALWPQDGTLAFAGTATIQGFWNASTGTLTLTGTDTLAAYQAALRAVTFEDLSDTPDVTNRTVTFTVNDPDDATSAPASRGVTVTATDDAPTLVAGGGAPIYQEGDPALAVDSAITVADPDSATLTGATVTITGNLAAAEDELVYTTVHGITGTFAPATGILSLSGVATPAQYQAALRTVAYRNRSAEPSTADRTISFTVADATSTSAAVSTPVRVVAVNTPAVLAGGGNTLAYSEGDPATVVNGAITVSDPDDTHLEGATVAISAGLVASEDRLELTAVHGISGTYDPATGILTLTGRATVAEYQAALRTVTYRNVNATTPATTDRTVSFVVDDGDDRSNAVTTTVTVTGVPDAPVVTTSAGNAPTFVENGSPVVVDDGVTVSDPDSSELSGAVVAISSGFSAAQGDTLGFVAQGAISGDYNATTGVLTLTGDASLAHYEAALRSITYANASDDPTTSRTVSFRVSDESGTDSSPATRDVAIEPVNDPPAVGDGGSLSYTENDAPTAISPALTVSDPDNATLSGATVAISSGLVAAEDRLRFTDQNGITSSYDGSTGTLTLSGTASVADYRFALRSVAYENLSDDPSDAARTVTYAVIDDGTPPLSASTTATITVVPVNDAPIAPDVTLADANAAIGNTSLVGNDLVDGAPDPAGPQKTITSTLRIGASDPDSTGLTVVSGTFATNDGGSVVLEADGDFVYTPKTGTSCSDTSDFFDYRVTDGHPTDPQTGTGRVTVTIADCVWYVRNNAAAGGDGRSAAPFRTLAAADVAATTAGATIYVYWGDGGTTGMSGGVTLATGQKLLGETEDLVVDGTTLETGNPDRQPSIVGAVELAGGNTVAGLTITAFDAYAIDGGAGDGSGTLRGLWLQSIGAAGRALSLVGTNGTWNVSDTTMVGADAAAGMVISNAGAVNFADAGTISVHSGGITVAGTQLSGTIDSTTVTEGATGVSLTSTTGSLALDDLNVTTSGTGLKLDNASGITIGTASEAAGSISGVAAVDISSDSGTPAVPPQVRLDQVSSTGGPYGIRVANIGTGTFSAEGGTLSGHTVAGVSITGGSGAIRYGGAISNGSGLSVRVDDRTGGTVALEGSIVDTSDAGGGIAMAGNSGGSTHFSGASVALDTGATNAVDLAFAGNHSVRFSGGGLAIQTTSGQGFRATSSNVGQVAVEGVGNTIRTGMGTALQVAGPDFTSAGATFRSISAANAVSGIHLADTGTDGGLTVTGTGTSGSGGTISGSTGPGIDLARTAKVSLAGVNVTGGGDDGIRGANVAGFALTGSSAITNNGNAMNERGLDFTELSGVVTIQNATVTGNADDNLAVVNDGATLTDLTIDGGTFGRNHGSAVGGDSVLIQNTGTGNTTATVKNVSFDRSRGDHVQITTDASNASVQDVTIEGNTMIGDGNQSGTQTLGGGITVNPAGAAQTTVRVADNVIERAYDSAIVVNSPLGSTAQVQATIDGNRIGTAGEAQSGSATGDGVYVNGHGSSTITTLIRNNQIRNWTNAYGIDIVQNDGVGTVNATVQGNLLREPDPSALSGMRLVVGSSNGDTGASCLDIGGGTGGALANDLQGTGVNGQRDIRFRMAGGPGSIARLPGYAGTANNAAAVEAYLSARNTVGMVAPTVLTTQLLPSLTFGSASSCPLPLP